MSDPTQRYYLIYYTDTGKIRGKNAYPLAASPTPGPGMAALPCDEDASYDPRDLINNGAIVRYTPTLADAQATKTVLAQNFFDGLFSLPNGFTFNGKLYQMDDASLNNWLILGVGADRSAANSTGFPWTNIPVIAADNSVTMMDMVTSQDFSQATFKYWASCRPVFRAIKDAILAVTNQAGLDAIDVTAGYPAAHN